MRLEVIVQSAALIGAALHPTLLADDGRIDVGDGRVVDHRHDGNVHIQPQKVNVDEIEESHSGHQIPDGEETSRKRRKKGKRRHETVTATMRIESKEERYQLVDADAVMLNGGRERIGSAPMQLWPRKRPQL